MQISSLNVEEKIRELNLNGVKAIENKISSSGYLDNFPILIDHNNIVVDGHHRIQACINLGIEEIPFIQKELTGPERKQLAFQANEASETCIPMTFVDYAEFIWGEEGTQQEIADILGWKVQKVKEYSRLQKVAQSAWDVIVESVSCATSEVENATLFSEGILRPIINLTPEQQLTLVTDLANETINKNKFKKLAENYQQQNKDKNFLVEKIGNTVPEILLNEALKEIDTGSYNLDDLIKFTIAKHNKETSIKLINGDFYEEIKNIQDESIDLIITDPPYNVANEREFVYEGRENRTNDFGEWDKHDHDDFKDQLTIWVEEFKRILSVNGSGYIFTSDTYLSHINEAIKQVDLKYRATLTWHKTNPGTSATKSNFISSTEYIVYFSNEKPVFNWFGENEMQNFIETPICGGNERMKNSKGKTLHPTQKPESVIKHLMDISSNKGSTVFDGFMGVGTTASVAKKNDRRFIGIEQEKTFFEAAQKRLK